MPIGDDQRQHLELARDVAERFNARFGETFVVPWRHLPGEWGADHGLPGADEDVDHRRHRAGGPVKLLDDLGHDPQEVPPAVTDSGREVRRAEDKPGVSNLVDILAVATQRTPEQVEAAYDGPGYGDLKRDVGEAVASCSRPCASGTSRCGGRARALRLLAVGAEKATVASAPTLAAMYERMGFVRLAER